MAQKPEVVAPTQAAAEPVPYPKGAQGTAEVVLELVIAQDGRPLSLPTLARPRAGITHLVNVAHPSPAPADPNAIDHFVYLHDLSFRAYEALLELRGERSVPRIAHSQA